MVALTAMYYSSGVLPLVEELMQMLLSTPITNGPLLFGAIIITYPFSFVDNFVCCDDVASNSSSNTECKSTVPTTSSSFHDRPQSIYKYHNEILVEIQRKLIALNDMLSSCGQMINRHLLFSFANQFALDVM